MLSVLCLTKSRKILSKSQIYQKRKKFCHYQYFFLFW
jgi:hypothetical protein